MVSLSPHLLQEWMDTSDPYVAYAQSARTILWRGPCGHEWRARISHRVNGSGCPYCSGRLAIPGETDLATLRPEVVSLWSRKNTTLLSTVTSQSNKNFWWTCFEGHDWRASASDIYTGKRCPYCSGRAAIQGKTDLETVNPHLASQWSPRNQGTASTHKPNSGKRVWWRCVRGHEWVAIIRNRHRDGHGCPTCGNFVSKPEMALAKELSSLTRTVEPSIIIQHKWGKSSHMSLDMIVDGWLAVEYDGLYWHDGNERHVKDEEKTRVASELGLPVVRVREQGLDDIPSALLNLTVPVSRGRPTDMKIPAAAISKLMATMT